MTFTNTIKKREYKNRIENKKNRSSLQRTIAIKFMKHTH